MPTSLSACPYVWVADTLVQVDAFQTPQVDFILPQNDFVQLDAWQTTLQCLPTPEKQHSAWFAIFGFGKTNRIILYEVMRAKKRRKEEYELLTAIAELEGDD